jgi:hypothetical protein
MHCEPNQPYNVYSCTVWSGNYNSNKDLSVIVSADLTFIQQCQNVASKASKAAYAIRRVFHTRHQQLMWPAFQSYILPIVLYCSPVWSPKLIRDINTVERVQRRFTKAIRGLGDLSYSERLKSLCTISLQQQRKFTDMVTIYKCLHGMMNCSPASLGLQLVDSVTRGSGMRLRQLRAPTSACAAHFACRAPSEWNKLPVGVVSCKTVSSFKNCLNAHYILNVSDFIV